MLTHWRFLRAIQHNSCIIIIKTIDKSSTDWSINLLSLDHACVLVRVWVMLLYSSVYISIFTIRGNLPRFISSPALERAHLKRVVRTLYNLNTINKSCIFIQSTNKSYIYNINPNTQTFSIFLSPNAVSRINHSFSTRKGSIGGSFKVEILNVIRNER